MNMTIKIRRFNQKGNEKYTDFVKKSKQEFQRKEKTKFKVPVSLINNKSLTEPVNLAGEIDVNKKFKNAFEYAEYLNDKIKNIDLQKHRWDDGLFNWISAAFFPNFFPGIRSGIDEKRVILSNTTKSKWRRHFARTLWEIYHVYQRQSLCLLFKETNNFSDELETISKSPIMFSSKGIVEAYSDLYFEEEKRIYDVKFEKLSNSRCFWEYYNRKINDYGTISKSFIYSLYRNNNDMNLIDEMSILEFVGPKITDINFPDDIIIVKNQTGKSLGMSLLALIIHDFDIVNAIMSLSR